MQSLQTIKQRLRSVKNIGQITKAMELVAATKMRRSQEVALASRPYAHAALAFLANLTRVSTNFVPPLLERRPIEKTAVVLVASDKGLTGSFNSAVFRAFEEMSSKRGSNASTWKPGFQVVGVGQKAVMYLERRVGKVEAGFTKFGDYTRVEEVRPLAEFLITGYLEERWDQTLVVYTNFRNALRQDVVVRELFPVTFESLRRTAEEIASNFPAISHHYEHDYIIEPSPEEVLTALVPHLVVMQIYHMILEANASEHAARRLAMKTASDNASEVAYRLTLEYNKSRQASITQEIAEIAAGAEDL
jgi:F-type H+-transporting ATPase subunit gamma